MKKKPTMKQMTFKNGLRNLVPKNFQGYELDKCTVGPDNKPVYVPAKYGSHSKKMNWGGKDSDSGDVFCPHCNLKPCITVEYKYVIEDAIPDDLLKTDEEQLLPILRRAYRKAVTKQCGKKFMLMLMPHDDELPLCAMGRSLYIAKRENGGYDSLLDEVPKEI